MDPTDLVPPNPVSSWQDYFDTTLPMPLHPLFNELEPYLPPGGKSVDLGCGVGHAVLFLADKGFEVDAYDGHAEALEKLRGRLTGQKVKLHHALLQDADLPEGTYDVVVAAYSLFFLEPDDFAEVWDRIARALKPGGLFVGELLGPNDDWAAQFTTQNRAEVERLLEPYEVLFLEEVDRDGFVSQGDPKHWHVFHLIGRKPA